MKFDLAIEKSRARFYVNFIMWR